MRPLVILHGVFGSSRNWQSVSRKLAELIPSKPIYPIDLRNHNCANNPKAIRGPIESWKTLQIDLEHHWHSSLNCRDFDLMGHSFGGLVAMSTLLSVDSKLREIIKKLVIVDVSLKHPSKGKEKDHTYELMEIMIAINDKKYTQRSDVIKHLGIIEPNSNIVNFLALNLVKSELDGTFSFSNLALNHLIESWPRLKHDWDTKDFKPWNGEALFLKGELSDYIKTEDESEINRFFPNSKIEILKNAGHWPHFDNQIEFINKLNSFL